MCFPQPRNCKLLLVLSSSSVSSDMREAERHLFSQEELNHCHTGGCTSRKREKPLSNHSRNALCVSEAPHSFHQCLVPGCKGNEPLQRSSLWLWLSAHRRQPTDPCSWAQGSCGSEGLEPDTHLTPQAGQAGSQSLRLALSWCQLFNVWRDSHWEMLMLHFPESV